MKKKITGLFIMAMLLMNVGFANTTNEVITTVQQAFNKEFGNATASNWSKKGDWYKASFSLNGQAMEAYFTEAGALIGVGRNLLSSQLPLSLQLSFKKDYTDYWITNVFEFANENGSTYYLELENADKKILLKSNDFSNWVVQNKTKK